MINLTTRSYQKELLDLNNIPFSAIRQNMKELNFINTYLGGHAISLAGMKKILQKFKHHESITVCEIGCGGGDNLKAIARWCNKNSIKVSFIGIDLKQECIDFAKQQNPELAATWIASDYKEVVFNDPKPTIIFSSLFCHHFNDEEVVHILRWMKANTAIGFFINDLHRHALAYHSIKLLTGIFSRSYLVKNDAPLSVSRGFKKKEWEKLVFAANLPNCTVQWKWAFRHLITYHHDGSHQI